MRGYLDVNAAAAYLGVGRTYFLEKVAPFVRAYNFGTGKKGMRRWKPADLDQWADQRAVA